MIREIHSGCESEVVVFDGWERVYSLTTMVMMVIVSRIPLTPQILKQIPKDLHWLFRECIGEKKQIEIFGDYKEFFYPRGDLLYHAPYFDANGKMDGLVWSFNSDNAVHIIERYKKGHLLEWSLYSITPEHHISANRCFKNEFELMTRYYENGKRFSVTTWKNLKGKHGFYSEYYENGRLALKIHFWNGKKHGICMRRPAGSYFYRIGFYKNNVPVPIWNFWDILKIYWSILFS